ncbi:MAG: hypothetical protein C5B50_01065 [Verrucomicrobia bacterium]|nr:MAG: hypothetical protein C5B50_01065 [Verrucomicrobiota bacterium]
MDAKIRLTRKVQLEGWHFQGEVSSLRSRPWEVAVMALAQQHSGRVTPEDISRELLNGRLPVARRLMRICEQLGLLVRDESEVDALRITEHGERAAQSQRVFVPQPGNWTIWQSSDPLLPSPQIRVAPWQEASALDQAGKNRGIGASRSFQEPPDFLRQLVGKELELPLGKDRIMRIDRIAESVEEADKDELIVQISLNLSPGESSLLLETLQAPSENGTDASNHGRTWQSSATFPANVPYQSAWLDLLETEGLQEAWDQEKQILRVSFPEDDVEKAKLRRDLHIQQPALPGLGFFDATLAYQVPIGPATTEDACQWAEWKLKKAIVDYATRPRFEAWAEQSRRLFQDLNPVLPTREQLALQIRNSSDGQSPGQGEWHIRACLDWEL